VEEWKSDLENQLKIDDTLVSSDYAANVDMLK
jgi:hypothetical protein